MSKRKCGHCGKVGHYRSTCPEIKKKSEIISVISSETDASTDSENVSQEPKVIPETQSPVSTPLPQRNPRTPRSTTPPEAKEIMKMLNSDKKMLDEMTADFEFNPPSSSAEEPKQEKSQKSQLKKQQNLPKRVNQDKEWVKSRTKSSRRKRKGHFHRDQHGLKRQRKLWSS